MKRIFAAVMVLLCTMMFTVSCGDSKEADKPEDSGVYEVAMLISGKDVEDGAFNQKTWKSEMCIRDRRMHSWIKPSVCSSSALSC